MIRFKCLSLLTFAVSFAQTPPFTYGDVQVFDWRFLFPGVGAVARPVKIKLADIPSVLDFGADPTNTSDATAAFQAAMDSCPYDSTGASPYGGCLIYVPAGKYKIAGTLAPKHPGIVLYGACMETGPGEEPGWCSTLYATASNSGPMFSADPANTTVGVTAHIRGIGLTNITFDVTANPTMSSVIRLRSVSNMPVWSNVTVFGAAGTALDIGISANSGAQVSEGLTFENFYAYQLYAHPGTYSGAAIAPAVKLIAVNEILFHGGKIVGGKRDSSGNPLVLVESDPSGVQPGYAITFDGVSTASYDLHYRVHGIGTVSPNWVRWENCTIENYNIGIAINDTSPPTFPSKALFVDKSTRFFAVVGSSPKKINADWVQQSAFWMDFWNSDIAPVTLGANSTWNEVHGVCDDNYIDNGHNACMDVDASNSGFIIKPQLLIKSDFNPFVTVWNPLSTIKTKIQSLSSIGFIGTESDHPAKFGTHNTPHVTILPDSGGGAMTIDNVKFSAYNNTSQSAPAYFEIDPATQRTTLSGLTDNPSLLRLNTTGSSSGKYLDFADTQIGGQTYGLARLRWTRDSGQGRSFSIYSADNAGTEHLGFFQYLDGKIGVGGGFTNSSPPLISGTGTFATTGDTIRLWTDTRTPANSSTACYKGDTSYDASYLYICIANNSWKRVSLASF